jgi:hypothetical protein
MRTSIRLFFVALLCCLPLLCQTENASISGRVTDPSGSAVVDATVSVTSIDTGTSLVLKTNGVGFYIATGLMPGKYRVTVSKEGFQTINLTGIELNVQDYLSKNFELKVGSVSEQVTVLADALNVNTTNGSVSTVVDQNYVKNMPLNGRSFQDLILLTPGVVTQTPQSPGTLGATGEFSVNGQRTESNYYTVDGVSGNIGAATGTFSGLFNTAGGGASGSVPGATAVGTTQALVSVDALQEFRVQSSTYSAEFGRNPGGQFAFDTKSGTNQWHGSAYDYLRNGFVDAQDWFNDYLGTPNGALRQNDFGGTFGGPVSIPHLYSGKDKTFFFVSYEGLRLNAPQPATTNVYVPDVALRASTPAPLNQVVNAYPLPTPGGQDFSDGTAQYIASWANPSSINSTSVRFDHNVSSKLRLFFRFSNSTSSSAARGNPAIGYSPSVNTISGSTVRTYTAGATSLFSSRISNDFRLNYSSTEATGNSGIDPIGGSAPVDLLQFSGVNAGSEVTVCIFNAAFSCLGLEKSQWSAAQRQWNLVDTVNLSFGSHQFKFGVDFRRLTPNAVVGPQTVGYDFFDESSVQANSAFALVSAHNSAYPLYKNFSAFAQDQWRVLRRFTLDLGLRWEVNPPPGVTKGLMPYTLQGSNFDTMAVAPQGTPLWKTTWFNFAPRLGAAYTIRDKQDWETVVRGGGGVFFDTGQQNGSLGFAGPGFNSLNFGSGSYGGQFCDFNTNCAPVPAGLILPIENPPNPPYNPVFGFSPHLQLPYTLHWNASIEQALGKSQALTISYVGSHGSRLLQANQARPQNNPNTLAIVIVQNGLTSDYDALQTQFQRRLSRGLTALASYTWSHCLDYGSSNTTFGFQRGNCDFDVRHNFSAAFSWNLPNVGQNGFVNAVLHNWGLDDRFTVRTAFPLTLLGGGITGPDGKHYNEGLSFVHPRQPVYLYGANCASVLQNGPTPELLSGQTCPGGKALNPNAFMDVTSGFGDAPRNFARLFGAWQMDLAVRREFPIQERLKIQFRAEAFNIFNHPNFGNVDESFGDSKFGLATGTLATALNTENALYQLGGPRSMQFALKLIF